MPSYYPEGDAPSSSDTKTRLLAKAASLAEKWAGEDGLDVPESDDTDRELVYKLAKNIFDKANA